MPDNKKKLLQAANYAYRENRPKDLKKLVSQVIKIGQLAHDERRQISNYLNILGQGDQALKILGKIMGTHELQTANIEELSLQAEIASKLIFHSANYTASRLFENIDPLIHNKLQKTGALQKWPYYNGMFLSYTFRSKESLPVLENAIDFYSHDKAGPEFKFTHLILLKSVIDLGDYKKALNLAKSFEKVFAKEDKRFLIFLEAIKGEANLALGNLEEAKKFYDNCILEEERNSQSPTLATFYRAIGDYYRLKGNNYRSGEYYLWSRQILDRFKQGPSFNWFPLLYTIESHSGVNYQFKHKLFLRLYPTFSPYIKLIEGTSLDTSVPPQCRTNWQESANDSWIVHRNQIQTSNYFQFLEIPAKSKHRIVDLVTGRLKKESSFRFETLSHKQSRCLRALLGSSHIGIKNFHLLDYVYRQDFIDFQSGQARMDKLIASLRKMGFKIELKETRYYFSPNYNDIFVCPKGNRDIDPVKAFSHLKKFKRSEVDDFFGLKKSRSFDLIQTWLENKEIKKERDDFYSVVER